jgi:hypothetical protein
LEIDAIVFTRNFWKLMQLYSPGIFGNWSSCIHMKFWNFEIFRWIQLHQKFSKKRGKFKKPPSSPTSNHLICRVAYLRCNHHFQHKKNMLKVLIFKYQWVCSFSKIIIYENYA